MGKQEVHEFKASSGYKVRAQNSKKQNKRNQKGVLGGGKGLKGKKDFKNELYIQWSPL